VKFKKEKNEREVNPQSSQVTQDEDRKNRRGPKKNWVLGTSHKKQFTAESQKKENEKGRRIKISSKMTEGWHSTVQKLLCELIDFWQRKI
jgi:hypothetical protein